MTNSDGDAPTCERAQYRECAPVGCKPYPGKRHRWDCNEHNTKAVGTYPAGHYGIHEMAGNGYEWTASVGVESILEPGETRTITIRFDEAGPHTFLCTLPGHAAAGMTGAVYVKP